MINFKQLIEQVTEARAQDASETSIEYDSFRNATRLPNELLLMALQALEEYAAQDGYYDRPDEARETLQAIRAKLESEIK